jgi:hypothetical protein
LGLELVALLTACDPGDTVLLAPESATDTISVSIRAVVDTPYAALASSLRWSDGVPGAKVRVHVKGEPYGSSYWRVAIADGTGAAAFPNLLGGLYEVEVTRTLTSAEQTQTSRAVHLVAGGRWLYLPALGQVEVTTAPDAPGSLIFSEFATLTPPEWETGGTTYPDAIYVEIVNNSDTTIYLDHKYLGSAFWSRDYSFMPCAQTEVLRNDPEGIWTEFIFRFPGRGSDHPLPSGHTALIAKSAIDHRSVLPTLPDLSHADFELGGYRGANNPDVPDLEEIGVRPMPGGPGFAMPAFLANPVDLQSLPRRIEPYSGHVFVRLPRAQILDAASATYEAVPGFDEVPPCLDDLHRAFERLPGGGLKLPSDFQEGRSLQRRVLLVLPDGRKLLQDTNTSMFDFVKAPRTPGWIPDSLPEPP